MNTTDTTAPAGTTGAIRSMSGLMRANRAAGHHFFSRGALQFFDSRIDPFIYPSAARAGYFVTSEQFHGSRPEYDTPRRWTVRRYDYTPGAGAGTIDTVASFAAASAAHAAAGRAAAAEKTGRRH